MKKYLLFPISIVLLLSGCNRSTEEKRSVHTNHPPVTRQHREKNIQSPGAMDQVESTRGSIAEKATQTLNEARGKADTIVETIRGEAVQAFGTVQDKLKAIGSHPPKEPAKKQTLYDRISDAVHHAEETTQSIGTATKVINTARHVLEPILK